MSEVADLIRNLGVPGFAIVILLYTLYLNNQHSIKLQARIIDMEVGQAITISEREAYFRNELSKAQDEIRQLREDLDSERLARQRAETELRAALEKLQQDTDSLKVIKPNEEGS